MKRVSRPGRTPPAAPAFPLEPVALRLLATFDLGAPRPGADVLEEAGQPVDADAAGARLDDDDRSHRRRLRHQ